MRTSNRLDRGIAEWLEAELSGLEARAEAGLERVFVRLPLPAPSAGFATATMQRLGMGREVAATPAGWALRLAAAACLALAGLAIALLPSILLTSLRTLRWSWLVDWSTALVVGAVQRVGRAASVWLVLADVGDTVAAALATPTALALLTLSLAVSFAALRALTGLVSVERRRYV